MGERYSYKDTDALRKMTMKTPIEVYALGSGSSGNSTLVRAGHRYLLIDAGLSLKALSTALAKRGVYEGNLDGILLTHEHSDHSLNAGTLARRYRTHVYANAATLEAYQEREGVSFRSVELNNAQPRTVGHFCVESFSISHDAVDPVGYVVQAENSWITYCTDIGTSSDSLKKALNKADLAILEANHDIDMLLKGPYSPIMKARVASRMGHLSNQECGDLLAERVKSGKPVTIWLAHLSRVNNTPSLALRTVQRTIRQVTEMPYEIHVAMRDQPSLTWRKG